MEAQHNGDSGFDGLEASFEIPLDEDGSATAKANLRVSTPALVVAAVAAAVILGKADAIERLLNAVPALAERVGTRVVAAA